MVKQTERPHPLTPLVRGWLVFVAIVVDLGRELVPDGSDDGLDVGDLRWILPIVAGVVVLAAVAGFFTWYFTRFVIDDEELRIETGCDLQEVQEDPVRTAAVGRHHPTAGRPDLRAGRAAARGRRRRQHDQAALPDPPPGRPGCATTC